MRWQIKQNAAKAHRTKTFRNEQVILLPPTPPMHQHHIPDDAASIWQLDVFLRQLLADEPPTLPQLSARHWLT